MGWIKLDDGFIDHPKFLEAGPLAGYLCIAGVAWSNRNQTDGFIPRGQVRRLVDFEEAGLAHQPDAMGLADWLVEVGLWHRDERGFRVHDYLDHQRSKAQIEAAIEQRREAGRRGGRARSASEPLTESSSEPLSELSDETPSESPSEFLSEARARFQAEVRSKKEEVRTEETTTSSSEIAKATPDTVRLSHLLADLIRERDPKAKVQPDSARWLQATRLLLADRDNDTEEVEAVLRWSQADAFWQANILSPSKLREKFTQLKARMGSAPIPVLAADGEIEKWRRRGEQWAAEDAA